MLPRVQSAINSLRGPITPQTYTPSVAAPLKPVTPAQQHDASYEWSRNHPASLRPAGGAAKQLPGRPNLWRPPGGLTGQPVANPIPAAASSFTRPQALAPPPPAVTAGMSPYGPVIGPIYSPLQRRYGQA